MKRNTIRLLAAIALISGFSVAHAEVISLSSTDLPYDMGAHPADQTVYSVFHDHGSFDELRIYSVALTACQQRTLVQRGPDAL